MRSLLKLHDVYPKGDCDLSEVEEKKLLSIAKNITTYSDFPQSKWGKKKTQQNCHNLFENTDTVTYNLPISLADQTL